MQSNGTYSSILELQKILQFPWRYHIIIPFIWSEMYMICHLNRYCSYYFWLLHNLNMDSKNLPWKTSITKSWLNFSHLLYYSVKTMYFWLFSHFEHGQQEFTLKSKCYKIVVKFFSRALLQCENDVLLTFTQFEYGQQEFTLKNKCYKTVVKFFSRALLQCENDVFLVF